MAVTLKDIADRLNLSIATVSFALRGENPGRFKLNADTVSRIRETAREMGYRPNRVAASLVNRRTHMVGVLIPDVESDFYARIFSGISEQLEADYLPVVGLHRYDLQLEIGHLNTMISNRVDGVIAAYSGEPAAVSTYRELTHGYGIPLCLIDRGIEDLRAAVVRLDPSHSARLAVQTLFDLGHREILYGSAQDGLDSVESLKRGFRNTAHSLGILCHLESSQTITLRRHFDEHLRELAKRVVVAWKRLRYSAILVNTDTLAYEILRLLRGEGVRVPGDVSVMGIDDAYPSSLPGISLSTVHTELALIGREAVRLLRAAGLEGPKQRIESREDPGIGDAVVELPSEVVLRRTTAPPARSRIR